MLNGDMVGAVRMRVLGREFHAALARLAAVTLSMALLCQ
jgi:hypothetical protein